MQAEALLPKSDGRTRAQVHGTIVDIDEVGTLRWTFTWLAAEALTT